METQAQSAANEQSPIRRIVIPVQGTDREFLAQEHAISLASALGVPLAAVHVRNGSDDRSDDVFAWVRKHATAWGVALEERALMGEDPAQVLTDELDPLDLVVIGSRRLGGRYHVGSVADRLIRDAPCPVQVVRLPE